MNDSYIISVYVVIDDLLKASAFEDDSRASHSAAELITVAVLAAKYFQNHHERALCILSRLGYIKAFSISRFNRRLHALRDWVLAILEVLNNLFRAGEVFIIDSMPLPVCKRVRARRSKKLRGREYYGYCASKKEKFFGWRLHLICTAEGLPVSFELLPAAYQDLTALHELAYALPEGACLYGDKGLISEPDAQSLLENCGIRLVTWRRKNMSPNTWADDYDLAKYRKRIETVYSQMEAMGIQSLHARTHTGFDIKTWASLIALAFTNLID